MTTNIGWGYGPAYSNLSSASGCVLLFTPLIDVEYKYLYNFKKRIRKNKRTAYNSGNYVGLRALYRGKATYSNILRTSNNDYAIGTVWGLQPAYGRVNLLFDIGVYHYFDKKYNGVPPLLQPSIGYNLYKYEKKKN